MVSKKKSSQDTPKDLLKKSEKSTQKSKSNTTQNESNVGSEFDDDFYTEQVNEMLKFCMKMGWSILDAANICAIANARISEYIEDKYGIEGEEIDGLTLSMPDEPVTLN